MTDDLKETFDGYLNFDFSNFHNMMAEVFVNENDELGEEINEDCIKQKIKGIPGPYIRTPQIEFENQGDKAEHIYYDQDSENISNYSKFNLLANLDFEIEEEEEIQMRKSSKCTKKMSLFSPSIHFDDDQKITMINVQNIDILKEDYDLDDFYKFLTTLDFLNVQNNQRNEEQDQQQQSIQVLMQIRQQFENLIEIYIKRTLKYQSISFNSKLNQYQSILEQFILQINYIIDSRDRINNSNSMITVEFFKGLQLMELFKELLMQKFFVEQQKKMAQAKKVLKSHWITKYFLLKSKGCYVTMFKRDKEQRQSITMIPQQIDWGKLELQETTYLCRNKVPNRPIFIGLNEYFKQASENKLTEACLRDQKVCMFQGVKKRSQQIHQKYHEFKSEDDYFYQQKL
ncbi:unnamed protein product [Paramecium primaurelia]|uniref:Uncharacterized protein n=1 Tax=Paramecium primaurelia TaxID=5886 RepID=A0A8S1N1N1_PARPR|nr:unnamed protein product [Paramecium primaurelia]